MSKKTPAAVAIRHGAVPTRCLWRGERSFAAASLRAGAAETESRINTCCCEDYGQLARTEPPYSSVQGAVIMKRVGWMGGAEHGVP
jgi:hypothetical protein